LFSRKFYFYRTVSAIKTADTFSISGIKTPLITRLKSALFGIIADICIMMNKTIKTAFFFLALFSILLCSCGTKKEEINLVPPVTSPLSGEYIGFGVIKESFTHINSDPSQDSPSLGYLRRGARVRIVRRQIIKTLDSYVSWVLTDGQQQGWLKEDVMDIYKNENQAITASELLSR